MCRRSALRTACIHFNCGQAGEHPAEFLKKQAILGTGSSLIPGAQDRAIIE